MSVMRKNRPSIPLALLTILGAMVSSVRAKEKPFQGNTWQTARVIAHLALTGGPVSEMFLETQNRRQYLFVRQSSKEDYTVIDVSKPERPGIVDNVTLPNLGRGEKVRMVGSGLALDETPESAGTGGVRHELVFDLDGEADLVAARPPVRGHGDPSRREPAEALGRGQMVLEGERVPPREFSGGATLP